MVSGGRLDSFLLEEINSPILKGFLVYLEPGEGRLPNSLYWELSSFMISSECSDLRHYQIAGTSRNYCTTKCGSKEARISASNFVEE